MNKDKGIVDKDISTLKYVICIRRDICKMDKYIQLVNKYIGCINNSSLFFDIAPPINLFKKKMNRFKKETILFTNMEAKEDEEFGEFWRIVLEFKYKEGGWNKELRHYDNGKSKYEYVNDKTGNRPYKAVSLNRILESFWFKDSKRNKALRHFKPVNE